MGHDEMKKILLKHMKNNSNQNVFVFSVSCSCCNKTWSSPPAVFSKAGEVPANESKKIIYDSIYMHEMQKAANAAVESARMHFNYCPVCKKLICNHCFMICEDIDMCVGCANELHEQGELVSA